jgi:hypothetical protein
MYNKIMSIPYDLVLIPSSELSYRAIEASKLAGYYDNFFTLEIGKFYPHISLYMFNLDQSGLLKVEKLIKDITKGTKAIKANSSGYSLTKGPGAGYVFISYAASIELKNLQEKIIGAINPIRSAMNESEIVKMQNAEGIKLDNFQKYGYPYVGGLFKPHLTLTRLREYNPDVIELLPSNIDLFNGIFDRIGLFERGPNGTCIKQIATWDL